MYKFIEKYILDNSIVLSNKDGSTIYVEDIGNNGKRPIVSSFDSNLDLKEVIDSRMIETPYGNINFANGFLFKKNHMFFPVVSSFLDYKVKLFPNINTLNLIMDMHISPYNKKVSELLNISNLDEKQKQDFNRATYPLQVGLEMAKMPKFIPNNSQFFDENTVKFLGIDQNENLIFGYYVKTDNGLYSGTFSINEIILSSIYQGIYIPSFVFQDNIDAGVLKKITEIIFKNDALSLGNDIGNIITSHGIKISVDNFIIPMFPNSANDLENILELALQSSSYNKQTSCLFNENRRR